MKKRPFANFIATFIATTVLGAMILRSKFLDDVGLSWLLSANVVAYLFWAWDKRQARRSGFRVPESVLHAMALLGAAPASLIAIYSLRHKSRKPAFTVLYVAMLGAQIGFLCWLGSVVT